MRAFVQRGVFVLLALLAARGDGLRGQWKIVAPNLFPGGGWTFFGALHVKDGIIWAGVNSMMCSRDTGKSWQPSSFTGVICDINFFDTSIGVIGAHDGVYLTSDGAKTWRNLLSGSWIRSVAFGSSVNVVYALGAADSLYATTNMGLSWRRTGFGRSEATTFTLDKAGTIYVFSFRRIGVGLGGWINSSTDLGQTWTSNGNLIDGDSYTLIRDSCDTHWLYLANEDYAQTNDNLSQIFVSTNAGASWQAGFTAPIGVIAGSISAGARAIYAGTMDSDGVLCSLDRGRTWRRIGGPSVGWDVRNIVAFDDSTVFGIDKSGSIWAWFDSGEFARNGAYTFTVSPDHLFSSDSIFLCQSSSTKTFIRSWECAPSKIISERIIGGDSEDYRIAKRVGFVSGYDSLEVTFTPSDSGKRTAQYELTLDNGMTIPIPLLGYGIPSVPLSLSSSNETSDTLGGSIFVPISISGLARPENIDLVLHYDPMLVYDSSVDPSNIKLDIPGEQWPGRSKLHIAQAASGVIAGYAHFTVFADSGAKPQVTFDSLTVLSAVSPCEYTLPAAVTSTITPPAGCGTPFLSHYLQSGQIPTFGIRPNPTTGDVELTSSLNLGDASVEMYDILGMKRGSIAVTLAKDAPAHLTLPQAPTLGAGMYYLRVKSAAGVTNLRVVVAR